MTFGQLATKLGIHLLDLIPDEDVAASLRDVPIFRCGLLQDVIDDGYLTSKLEFVKPYEMVEFVHYEGSN